MQAADRVFLEAALELAERGRFTCAPNPTVGCLIWRNGEVIGRGYHQRTGGPHAEVNAIADAGGDVAGATVYVTLEPCAFVSRTPACAQTLIDADVARVVVAARDPHPQVDGHGIDMLRAAGIEVTVLPLIPAAESIAGYVTRITSGRPLVRVKTASSLDGSVALANGESQWITGEAARMDVQYWRARADAIITGVGTVLEDDPQLNVRAPEYSDCHQPLRVVLDSHLRTPASARLVTDGGPTVLVHRPDAEIPAAIEAAANVTCLAMDPQDLDALLAHLGEQCNEVLVEAGPGVCGSFADAGLWDEWLCYVAPKWLGSDARHLADFSVDKLSAAPHGDILGVTRVGDDLCVRIGAKHGEHNL